MRLAGKKRGVRQAGFTLTELMIATLILLIGLVGVAQLVPASIVLNSGNRTDSTALVFAQRELEQMLEQPLAMPLPQHFLDAQGNDCSLGDPTQPNRLVGNPVVIVNNRPMIDFSATPISGYSLTYQDPNDPYGAIYDLRWAVITNSNGSMITSKRFILGARMQSGNGFFQPLTLDALVER